MNTIDDIMDDEHDELGAVSWLILWSDGTSESSKDRPYVLELVVAGPWT